MTPFNAGAYNRGAYAPEASDTTNALLLTASTSACTAVPAGAAYVSISCASDFYAKFGNSSVVAAVPGAAVTDGTGSTLNPAARAIPYGVTHIAVISATAGPVTFEYWGS